MDKKWMPVTAGIINSIYGIAAIIIGALAALIGSALSNLFGSSPWYGLTISILIVIIGALALTGGIYAFKRKKWALALSGGIGAFILTLWSLEYWLNTATYGFGIDTLYGFIWAPAVFSVVLTVLSKKQFGK